MKVGRGGGRKKKKVGVLRFSGREGGKWGGVIRSFGPEDRRWGVLRSSEPEDRRNPHLRRAPFSSKKSHLPLSSVRSSDHSSGPKIQDGGFFDLRCHPEPIDEIDYELEIQLATEEFESESSFEDDATELPDAAPTILNPSDISEFFFRKQARIMSLYRSNQPIITSTIRSRRSSFTKKWKTTPLHANHKEEYLACPPVGIALFLSLEP